MTESRKDRNQVRVASRVSLRGLMFLVTVLGVLFAMACQWVAYPRRTAQSLLAAIRAKSLVEVESVLGEQPIEGEMSRLVASGKYNSDSVQLHGDDRTMASVLRGRQSFFISGYGGAHRFTVVRGRVTELRYMFISGAVEYVR